MCKNGKIKGYSLPKCDAHHGPQKVSSKFVNAALKTKVVISDYKQINIDSIIIDNSNPILMSKSLSLL